jgi:hypothetical protein
MQEKTTVDLLYNSDRVIISVPPFDAEKEHHQSDVQKERLINLQVKVAGCVHEEGKKGKSTESYCH